MVTSAAAGVAVASRRKLTRCQKLLLVLKQTLLVALLVLRLYCSTDLAWRRVLLLGLEIDRQVVLDWV